jgi:hypothetical protein
MWIKRTLVGKELSRGLTFPVRLVRLLRHGKARRSPPSNEP